MQREREIVCTVSLSIECVLCSRSAMAAAAAVAVTGLLATPLVRSPCDVFAGGDDGSGSLCVPVYWYSRCCCLSLVLADPLLLLLLLLLRTFEVQKQRR